LATKAFELAAQAREQRLDSLEQKATAIAQIARHSPARLFAQAFLPQMTPFIFCAVNRKFTSSQQHPAQDALRYFALIAPSKSPSLEWAFLRSKYFNATIGGVIF
jgi:hypothetical protein